VPRLVTFLQVISYPESRVGPRVIETESGSVIYAVKDIAVQLRLILCGSKVLLLCEWNVSFVSLI